MPEKPTYGEFIEGLDKLPLTKQLEFMNKVMSFPAVQEALKNLESSPELSQQLKEVTKKLNDALNQRAGEFGLALKFNLSSPELPKDLTPEQLKLIQDEIFKGNSEVFLLPTPKELDDFSTDYLTMMYPKTQEGSDSQKTPEPLTSYCPSWFENPAKIEGFDFGDETWFQAYLRSIKQELETFKADKASFVLLETTQKPNYTDGSQHYGTKEGTDPSQDLLLSIFQEVFNDPKANRFNHTFDELTNQLIPKIEEKIKQLFQDKKLPIPKFKVILCPTYLFNLQTTLLHPANSQTNTWERSSTPLLDTQNKDTVLRLGVGGSSGGGASNVGDVHRGHRFGLGGARFAVVFYH